MKTLKRINLKTMGVYFSQLDEKYLATILGGAFNGSCVFDAMAYFSCSFSGVDPCSYYDPSMGMSQQSNYANQYAQEYADSNYDGDKLVAMNEGVQSHQDAFDLMNNHFDLYDGDPKNASSSDKYYATFKTGEGEEHAVAITDYDESKDEYTVYDPSDCSEKTMSGDTQFTTSYLVKPKEEEEEDPFYGEQGEEYGYYEDDLF